MSDWHLGRSDQNEGQSEQNVHDASRYVRMRNVSLVGMVANIFLSTTKIIIGWVAQSQSLIADGIHSLADALTDAAVIVTARFSNQGADAGHPYGHARIETAATAGLGVVLIVTGLGIILDAAGRLMDPSLLFEPTALALLAAFMSILINEALYQYTRWVGIKIKSSLLLANAWHHRTDALSSVVVMIGVGGVLMGWETLDAIAAVAVSMMIIHVGWQQLRGAFVELIDAALPAERIKEITRVIEGIEGVSHPHRLRTRRMGEHALIDVHIEVAQRISVSEGHQLAERVQAKLKDALEEVNDVIVHIDPKGQETVWLDLPDRTAVCGQLHRLWATELGEGCDSRIRSVLLHYLDGQIEAEVIWVEDTDDDPTQAKAKRAHVVNAMKVAEQALSYVRAIQVSFISNADPRDGHDVGVGPS